MRPTKRIRTVLYGDQKLSAAELEVIHTPAMQRLYSLRQLGLTDRVFIDASHSRIHHVVGVLHQIDKLTTAISSNLWRSNKVLEVSSPAGGARTISARRLARYVRNRKSVIRFIGLLHDLTHAPFGHTIEDEIKLAKTKHDDPERQGKAFYRLLCQLVAWITLEAFGPNWEEYPESLRPFLSQNPTAKPPEASEVGNAARELINRLTDVRAEICLKLSPKHIAEMFAHLGCAMTALLHLEALHTEELTKANSPEESEYPFQHAIRIALEGTKFEAFLQEFSFDPHRDAFMLDIVGNTVCADLLDYAARDSQYAGLRLNYDSDRIAENFTLVRFETKRKDGASGGMNGSKGPHDPFKGWCIRTAISLVSHKYRTDIPSELMNLLNVRFYLYERVIFHSTKCAAGSMLGTALQFLGWRNAQSDERRRLPEHLQFVGDEVFLHDIAAALDFLVSEIPKVERGTEIDKEFIDRFSALEGVHNGVIRELLLLRTGESAAGALEEFRAARLLLCRLASRRYFRPVFRAMPNTDDAELQLGADALAELFKDPDKRFNAEREIEVIAGLPRGTITIHCPKRNTAEKVANVLLTKPTSNTTCDPVYPLYRIKELDAKTFEKHEEAVNAVQKMYQSMWRLTVYAAPELMAGWVQIEKAAGKAIWGAVYRERVGPLDGKECQCWLNDPDLRHELEGKTAATPGTLSLDSDLTPLGEDLGRTFEELSNAGQIGPIPAELYSPEEGFTPEGRKRMEDALIAALSNRAPSQVSEKRSAELPTRTQRIITLARFHVTPTDGETEQILATYPKKLDPMSPEEFELIRANFESGVKQSVEIDSATPDQRGGKQRKKKLRLVQVLKLLDNLIDQRSLLGPPEKES